MLAQNIMQNKLSNGALDDNLRTVYGTGVDLEMQRARLSNLGQHRTEK